MRDDVLADALTRLALEVQSSIVENDLQLRAIVDRLNRRDYTKGEILYAVDQLADDPELDDKLRYGGDLSAADFRRVIEPIREIRKRLLNGEILTEQEVDEAVRRIPEIDHEDFGACRDDRHDRRFVLASEGRDKLD